MNRILAIGAMGAVLTAATTGCRRDAAPGAVAADPHAGMVASGDSATPGVTVSAAERSRLGIVLTTVQRGELVRQLRLVGRVVPAETSARTVTTKVDGFVEHLYVDFTGRAVAKGEALFDLYSPMLVAAQQELLLAARLRASLSTADADEARRNADSLVAASRRRLEYWDVPAGQIAELERSGTVSRVLTMRAPAGGVVLQKSVVQGQAIMAGAPLFQIADLSTVWLEADVFETDLAAVRVGQAAEVSFDAYPGEVSHGRVTYVYPTVDPASRTGRVRIDLPNRFDRVRPGLFGTARIVSRLGGLALLIPRQAALVTGERQLVFVLDSLGRFVPRPVRLGAESDSQVQVLSGLRVGERIVATAAFLLDAESNLGAAMAGMAGMDRGSAGGANAPVTRRRAPAPAPRRDSGMPGMPMPTPDTNRTTVHQHQED